MTFGRAVAMAAACVLGLLGAPADAAGAEERPLAVATISILADFVRAVAGDRLEVTSIVHVGGDPHTYEPVPSDARRIADADVVVRNGLGLERWLDRLIATNAKVRVVTATDGLAPGCKRTERTGGIPIRTCGWIRFSLSPTCATSKRP